MDISAVSKCYKLTVIEVSPDQLLLDPNNPRIIIDVERKQEFTEQELASSSVQDYILSVINKEEYHIADLIRGMKASGFLRGLSDIIVQAVPHTNKYLVLEGNRRTTALKFLLTQKNTLNPQVLRTLNDIPVKEFTFSSGNGFTQEEVIDILLGTIHITGPLGWGALEKAHYIYKSYIRDIAKNSPDFSGFRYDRNCAGEVATLFNLSTKAVRKMIQVYRVYQQLKENGYQVQPHHFTLIDLAVGDRELSSRYFCLDDDAFHFSKTGLERINTLCINENKPINNPKDFRVFAKIFKHGTPYEVSRVESNSEPVQDILSKLNGRLGDRAFLARLESVKDQLKDLCPTDYRGVNAEVEAIEKIKKLVDEKLFVLLKRSARK